MRGDRVCLLCIAVDDGVVTLTVIECDDDGHPLLCGARLALLNLFINHLIIIIMDTHTLHNGIMHRYRQPAPDILKPISGMMQPQIPEPVPQQAKMPPKNPPDIVPNDRVIGATASCLANQLAILSHCTDCVSMH